MAFGNLTTVILKINKPLSHYILGFQVISFAFKRCAAYLASTNR